MLGACTSPLRPAFAGLISDPGRAEEPFSPRAPELWRADEARTQPGPAHQETRPGERVVVILTNGSKPNPYQREWDGSGCGLRGPRSSVGFISRNTPHPGFPRGTPWKGLLLALRGRGHRKSVPRGGGRGGFMREQRAEQPLLSRLPGDTRLPPSPGGAASHLTPAQSNGS